MKAIKILTMAALATAVFASCSSEDELAQSNYPMDNVVRIMTSVDGMNTRASYGNSTDKLNSFGFCINNAGNTKYTYDNIKITQKNGNWNPATQMLWQNSTTAVDILAYAPYQETTEDANGKVKVYGNNDYAFAVQADQSNANDYTSDFIVYRQKNFTPGTELNANQAVDITFSHILSQLITSENIRIRQSVDKWNPEDDGETEEYLGRINHKIGSAEEFAYDIIERIGVQKYRNTVKSMEYLTLEELRTICAQVGNMRLVEH